ncbi:hypothetical protein P154DRAFT_179613 [Amniculicola lignicola CBS 123094]|uniref:Uncharacterized protein n=1 Tax=Amniculicola lignicola CBS 123094 TaxID=1392246 RepID=A0A6A5WYY6_9PLEO|nr:hypothetical protein P154DRAFT_179613 [Amniculicola lignicola CBS 123094]
MKASPRSFNIAGDICTARARVSIPSPSASEDVFCEISTNSPQHETSLHLCNLRHLLARIICDEILKVLLQAQIRRYGFLLGLDTRRLRRAVTDKKTKHHLSDRIRKSVQSVLTKPCSSSSISTVGMRKEYPIHVLLLHHSFRRHALQRFPKTSINISPLPSSCVHHFVLGPCFFPSFCTKSTLLFMMWTQLSKSL